MVKIVFNPSDDYKINELTRLVIRDKETETFILRQSIEEGSTFTFDSKILKAHWNYRYKFQVRRTDESSDEKRWVDITDYKRLYPERTGASGLKYLLYKKPKSKKLLVVFQAINKNPTYNYVGLLKDENVHKLFIKDVYGDERLTRTSYYLNYNTSFDVENSIVRLVEKVLDEVNLSMEDVIFAGSSKGGFAALYYAYKLGAGHVIAGGPQILLGDYLSKGHDEQSVGKNIFNSMFGEINENNINAANEILPGLIENTANKNVGVHIHVGYWEPHFKDHIEPFMEMAAKNKITNITLHMNDYETHSGLATYFPPFFKQTVQKISEQEE